MPLSVLWCHEMSWRMFSELEAERKELEAERKKWKKDEKVSDLVQFWKEEVLPNWESR